MIPSASDVWKVLVEECDARPTMWEEFAHHWPQCREFRFMGSLGFGGKVYYDSLQGPWVGNYREDSTDETRAAVRRANDRLRALRGIATHPDPPVTRHRTDT